MHAPMSARYFPSSASLTFGKMETDVAFVTFHVSVTKSPDIIELELALKLTSGAYGLSGGGAWERPPPQPLSMTNRKMTGTNKFFMNDCMGIPFGLEKSPHFDHTCMMRECAVCHGISFRSAHTQELFGMLPFGPECISDNSTREVIAGPVPGTMFGVLFNSPKSHFEYAPSQS